MIPTGATEVHYRFDVDLGGGEFFFTLEFSFPPTSSDNETDTALEAGADAIVASLQSQFPGKSVFGTRTYIGEIAGDPWPSP